MDTKETVQGKNKKRDQVKKASPNKSVDIDYKLKKKINDFEKLASPLPKTNK